MIVIILRRRPPDHIHRPLVCFQPGRIEEVESIYLWPDNPILSLFALWVVSAIFLWAARRPMLRLVLQLGGDLGGGIESAGKRVAQAAEELGERNRKVLFATGIRETQGRLDRELNRMDAGYSEQMGNYGDLQRRLDETLIAVERDYQDCGAAPPEIPAWTAAVETLASIPTNGDPNIQKVLSRYPLEMRRSRPSRPTAPIPPVVSRPSVACCPIGRRFAVYSRA